VATHWKARLFAVACCRQLSDLYDVPHCQRVIEYGLNCNAFEGRGLVVPEADCCLKALAIAEQAADEQVSEEELRALAEGADALDHPAGDYAAGHDSTDEYENRLVATGEIASAIHCACSNYPVQYSVFGQPSGAFENLGGVVWKTAQAAAFRKGLAYVQSIEGGDPDNMAVNAALLRDLVGNPFRAVTRDPSWLTPTVLGLAGAIYAEREFERLLILADALEDAGRGNADLLAHIAARAPTCAAAGQWICCWAKSKLVRTNSFSKPATR
jgi:hypothetical protein